MQRSKLIWFVPGILLGALAGYFYWKFYGCDGTCMITSSPWRSMIYFSVMGALVNNMFKPDKKKTTDPSGQSQ
jgi:F0F1-type ATP synthase assembly protein I